MNDHRFFGKSLLLGSLLLLASLYVALSDVRGSTGPESGRAMANRPKRETLATIRTVWEAAKWIGRDGYLAEGAPSPLRFSDDLAGFKRPPLPALPEFSVVSSEYVPYLLESPLPDDARADASQYSQMVVDLDPYEIVSGTIDTTIYEPEVTVDTIADDNENTSVLRPEEVLIFFETSGGESKTTTIIPFSPAKPSGTTIKSSAKYIKE